MPVNNRRTPQPLRPLVLLPGSKTTTHKHAPAQSSYLAFPPSPTSQRAIPRTPLTPPPRLHLRNFQADIPPSPLSPRHLASAPDIPYPWIWRCHKCHSIYRLGVTRRCLHDGHMFCSVPPQPDVPGPNSKGRSRKRKRSVGCAAEFDYAGWAQYNQWRRCMAIHRLEKAERKRQAGRHGEEMGECEQTEWQDRKDCWGDCEFPSECNNNRMQEEIERKRIAELFVESEPVLEIQLHAEVGQPTPPVPKHRGKHETEHRIEGEQSWEFQGQVMGIEEWEALLHQQTMTAFVQSQAILEMEKFAAAKCGIHSPALSSSSSSITTLSEEMDIVSMERRGQEGEAHLMDVSLGPPPPYSEADSHGNAETYTLEMEDEDLIYGDEVANRSRKKSIQKIAQLTGLMLGVESIGTLNPRRGRRGSSSDTEWKAMSPLKAEVEIFGDEEVGNIF